MNSQSLAVLLLANRLVDVDVKPFSSRDVWKLRSRFPDFSVILDLSAEQLMSEHDCPSDEAERIKRLCNSATALTFELERLEESGIRVVTFLDEEFPQRLLGTLQTKSSVFVLIAGNADLLNEVSRGIVGSRNASADSIEAAQSAARTAVRRGEHVVSGLAKGIDRVAMAAALENDGNVIGIPSEGLRQVAKGKEVRNLVHEGRICLLSPYGPDARFTVGNAMGRNRFIYGLSSSTLVVASDVRKGGTWAGAEEALKNNFSQVDVWTGDGVTDGNHELVAIGAHPVSSVDEFWEISYTPTSNGLEPDSEQLKLF
jgi:predicted Rossmann fold nucleotide-binding protein DprA/Smf involved in DNA uptake